MAEYERLPVDEAAGSVVDSAPSEALPSVLSRALFLWSFAPLRAAALGQDVRMPRVALDATSLADEAAGFVAPGESVNWRSVASRGMWAMRWDLLVCFVSGLASVIGSLAQPLFLARLLQSLASAEGPLSVRSAALAAGLVVSYVVAWFGLYRMFYDMDFVAARIVIYVKALVFRHALRLPSAPKGLVTALHNVDSARVSGGGWGFQAIRLPLLFVEVVGSFVILWQLLGVAVLGPVVVCLVLAPISFALFSRQAQKIREVSSIQDERVNALLEIFEGILVCKLFGWEQPMQDRVSSIRVREMKRVRSYNFVMGGIMILILLCVHLFAVSSFGILYIIQGKEALTASVIFPAMVIFDNLQWPILLLGAVVSGLNKAIVSLKRIAAFLNKEPLPELERCTGVPLGSVQLVDASCSWPKTDWSDMRALVSDEDEESADLLRSLQESNDAATNANDGSVLQRLNITFASGSLTVIVGAVGSGKTALLMSLLGELRVDSGQVRVSSGTTFAYCAQQPWIRSGTIRYNVLFPSGATSGNVTVDDARYRQCLSDAGLDADLAGFEKGDLTVVGENGIMLSGGQKARLALAASLYQDADVYLLDDVLSAVDARVAEFLIDKVILGLKRRGKTVVLVTHHLPVASVADQVFEMEAGVAIRTEPKAIERRKMLLSSGGVGVGNASASSANDKNSSDTAALSNHDGDNEDGDDIQSDGVSFATLKFYLSLWGYAWFACIVACTFAQVACAQFLNIWVSFWSSSYLGAIDYVLPYVVFALIVIVFSALQQILVALRTTHGSVKVHRMLLEKVISSEMRLFHSVSTGAIISRFSTDMNVVDLEISDAMSDSTLSVCEVVSIVFVLAFVSPRSMLFVIPFVALNALIMWKYGRGLSVIGQIKSSLDSPVSSALQESLTGATHIRAIFACREGICKEHSERIGSHIVAEVTRSAAGSLMRCMSNSLATFLLISMCGLGLTAQASPAFLGLSITAAVLLSSNVSFSLNRFGEVSSMLAHVERIRSLMSKISVEKLVSNDNERQGFLDVPSSASGAIDFDNVSLRYSQEGPAVLKRISFGVRAGERIGIVGRTGAGKTSIITALFRLSQFVDGRILISGKDAARVQLRDLREQMSIIPQVPFLFSGTIRSNLDPFGVYSDEQIAAALLSAHVSLPLDMEVKERGQNLSQGQRQLVCLARALLRDSPILLLDEATASVDPNTDQLILRTLEELPRKTRLTIAHRVHTILSCDRILVMSNGEIEEFDTPAKLLANENGAFSKLVKSASASGMLEE